MSGEKESKVVVVSNRLPYEITATSSHGQKDERTGKTLTESVSGLVTALEGLSRKSLWIGGIKEDDEKDFLKLLKDRKQKTSSDQELQPVQPVPIPSIAHEQHKKWSNCSLWFILHGMPERMDKIDCWKGYEEVNQVYANAIVIQLSKLKEPTAIIWIHDYHLFLVPKLVSEIARKLKLPVRYSIGFFLHTPFPSVETLEKLPNFKEILEGMLGSDSIGFHTQDYCLNFLKCCKKHMDCTVRNTNEDGSYKLQFQEREILVQAVPAGIVYETFSRQPEGQLSEGFEKLPEDLVHQLKTEPERNVLLIGVDRIDHTKGLLEKVKAFASENLQARLKKDCKFALLQIAVPCRTTETEYKNLGKEFKECVRVAKKFLKDNEYPSEIHVIEKLSQQDLSVLYRRADVALVTPVIDGLNLVAMEYIACQSCDQPGVLVLSKNAGAAKYLEDALKVDPNNKQEMAETIYLAVSMPLEERKEKMKKLQSKVKELNSERWIQSSLKPLRERVESRAKL